MSAFPLMPIAEAGGPLPQLSYVTNVLNNANQTTYTFTDVSFGATSERTGLVFLVAAGTALVSRSVVSVSAAGNAATVVATNSGLIPLALAYIADTTNTSGNVVVTMSGGAANCVVGVYRLLNATSIVPVVTNNLGQNSITLTGARTGDALAVLTGTTGSTTTFTNVAQDYNTQSDTGFAAGASGNAVSADPVVTADSGTTNRRVAAGAWR
jgi:hypothetical protein